MSPKCNSYEFYRFKEVRTHSWIVLYWATAKFLYLFMYFQFLKKILFFHMTATFYRKMKRLFIIFKKESPSSSYQWMSND